MPVDWSDYLSSNKITMGDLRDDPGGKYTVRSNGLGELVQQVIQGSFPQYSDITNTKILKESPEDYNTLASYSPASDSIKLGRVTDSIATYTKNGKPVGGANGPNSNDVIEAVTTTMHELYHARSANAKATGNFEGPNLGSDWKGMLKEASAAGFPSIGIHTFGGDNIEEFLATAVPVTQMQAKGMTLTGRYKNVPNQLADLNKKYPWLSGFIQEHAMVEQTASKIAPTTSVSSMLESLKSIFK